MAVCDSFIVMKDGRRTQLGAGCRAWGSWRGGGTSEQGGAGEVVGGFGWQERRRICHLGPSCSPAPLPQDIRMVVSFLEDFQL